MIVKVKLLAHHIELANAAVEASIGLNRALICPFAQALTETYPDHDWSVGTLVVHRDNARFAQTPRWLRQWIKDYDLSTSLVEGHLPIPLITPPPPEQEIVLVPYGETLEEAVRNFADIDITEVL